MQAQTNGIRNLIMKEYLDQLIPLPMRSIQEEIAKGVSARMNEAQAIYKKAELDLNSAKRRIEAMLLGEVVV